MLYILAAFLSVMTYFVAGSLICTPDMQLLCALVVFFGVIIYGKMWMIHYDLKNKDK